MEQVWHAVREQVLGQIRDAQSTGWLASEKKIVDLIIDRALGAGVDMRHESSLEQMKSLLVDALRAAYRCRDRASTSSPEGITKKSAPCRNREVAAVTD